MSESSQQELYAKRPLSPHLQIYKWQWTMLYSILHRATGIALSVGVLLLSIGIFALSHSPNAFDMFIYYLTSPFGYFVMIGSSWALFYHTLNGIRHLLWDIGLGFELETAAKTGHLFAMLGSVLCTAIFWFYVFSG